MSESIVESVFGHCGFTVGANCFVWPWVIGVLATLCRSRLFNGRDQLNRVQWPLLLLLQYDNVCRYSGNPIV